MAVALHYFDPAFRSNDDDQPKAIHRAEIESLCSQMFKDAVYESVVMHPKWQGVLLDKAGHNRFVLRRSQRVSVSWMTGAIWVTKDSQNQRCSIPR
jgi:hypothetical protein